METDDTQILRTIRELPFDDMPRLVYADWLEENGRAERAEFIRLQCAMATAADERRRQALMKRERQVWRNCAASWRAELPAGLRGCPFHRGFVQPRDLELTPGQFLALSSDYLDAAPTWSAKLFIHAPDPLPELARSPHLERLTRLSLYVNGADHTELDELLASARLKNLRSLHVEGRPFQVEHVRTIANAPALGGLRRLGLFCNPIREDGARALANSPHLKNLETLELNGCGLGEAGLRALASSTSLYQLRELNLAQNGLDDGAASAIIASRTFKRLLTLGLFGNHLGDAGARALAKGRNLERLTRLDLGLNRIGPPGARALADSPFFAAVASIISGRQSGER